MAAVVNPPRIEIVRKFARSILVWPFQFVVVWSMMLDVAAVVV